MDYYSSYIITIFIVKVLFIVLAVYALYIKLKKPKDKMLLKKVSYWKEKTEFIFITLMSILLLYLFYPKADRGVMIDNETKILLYLFGFVLLLTENWSNFIHESIWFKRFQRLLA